MILLCGIGQCAQGGKYRCRSARWHQLPQLTQALAQALAQSSIKLRIARELVLIDIAPFNTMAPLPMSIPGACRYAQRPRRKMQYSNEVFSNEFT